MAKRPPGSTTAGQHPGVHLQLRCRSGRAPGTDGQATARRLTFFSSRAHRCAAEPCAGSSTTGCPQEAPAALLQIRKSFRNGWPSEREAADFLQLTWSPERCGSGRIPGPEAGTGDRVGFLQRIWPPVRCRSMRQQCHRWPAPGECTCRCVADPEEPPERMAKRPRGG